MCSVGGRGVSKCCFGDIILSAGWRLVGFQWFSLRECIYLVPVVMFASPVPVTHMLIVDRHKTDSALCPTLARLVLLICLRFIC